MGVETNHVKETCRAVGKKIIIQNRVNTDDIVQDGIVIPNKNYENSRTVKGTVLSIGKDAVDSGLTVGDVVLYDKHAIYSRHGEGTHKEGDVIVVDIEGVISKIVE